jgi:RNA-binding protein
MRAEMDPERIKMAWQDPAMMQIGKGGLSDSVIEEARRLLKQHKYMKVRILRNAIGDSNKKELIESLCKESGAKLAGFRGNTAVIYKTREMRGLQ